MTSEDQASEQTHRARALQLWEELRPRPEALKVLERDLKGRRARSDLHGRTVGQGGCRDRAPRASQGRAIMAGRE